MARPTTPINLTQEQSNLRQRLVRRREAPHSLVQRAQIIRQAGQGINHKTISRNLGWCEDSVGLWRRRWVEGSVELENLADKPNKLRAAVGKLLADRERSGSPGKFRAEQICQFIALAGEAPPKHLSHWTHKDLIREAVKREIVDTLSTSSAGCLLKSGRAQAAPYQILAQP